MSADAIPKPAGPFEIFEASTAEQKDQLYRFRYQIFTQEQHKFVRSADHERRMLVDALDEKAVHLCVAKDGEIIGSLRQIRGREHATDGMVKNLSLKLFSQFPNEALTFTGRLLMLPEHRGSRALLYLLHALYNSARTSGLKFDFIFCNPHLVRFYEQIGYRRYRPYYQDADLGFQIPLVLVADDIEHLERIRSPLAQPARSWPSDPVHAAWFRESFPDYETFVTPATLSAEDFVALLGSKINRNDIPLLEDLSASEIQDLIESSTHFKLDSGTHLVRRGDMGQELYLILDGVSEVRRPTLDGRSHVLLATLGRGDVFGEISVLTTKPRSADVMAITELEVMFIDQISLKRFIKGKPAMAAKLLFNLSKILAERFEMTSLKLTERYDYEAQQRAPAEVPASAASPLRPGRS